jgi:AcrR family transcriptional regulator
VTAIPPRPQLLAAEALPPAPRQQRSRRKRAQLLAATLVLFAENGYEVTSVEAIATRAGVAVGSFYQHFRTKRQALLVLMDELLERLEHLDLRPPRANTIRAGLHSLLHAAFSQDLAYTGAYRAWREAVLLDPSLMRLQQQIERWTRARVRAVFESLLQLPTARHDVDVPVLAQLMDRLFWDLLGQAAAMATTELEAILNCITDLLYHALFCDCDARSGA